jgi:hypothetical protein
MFSWRSNKSYRLYSSVFQPCLPSQFLVQNKPKVLDLGNQKQYVSRKGWFLDDENKEDAMNELCGM